MNIKHINYVKHNLKISILKLMIPIKTRREVENAILPTQFRLFFMQVRIILV